MCVLHDMKDLRVPIPWFMAVPGFLAAVTVAALVANSLGADYFKRTRLDEANPLAAVATQTHDSAAATVPATAAADTPSTAGASAARSRVVSMGKFRDGAPGHHGTGKATLGIDADGRAVLVFEDFSVTNGPNLHVILGETADGGGTGVDLGKLKATDGTFSYEVPSGVRIEDVRSVTIWCASFPTVFAVAELEV